MEQIDAAAEHPSTHLLPELTAIDDYRIEHAWSWANLSDDMEKAGVEMSPRTLHHLCRRAHVDATVRMETLGKIRKYIARRRIRVPRRVSARRPAARVALHQ